MLRREPHRRRPVASRASHTTVGLEHRVRADFSLTRPGMVAAFKVYVVLTIGHAAGSDPVTVAADDSRVGRGGLAAP
ncbi:MAG: hypothetical protein K9N23_22475 [Akkermansiaceae bacterium]|nr:hypothetical protein [Akkermansiaceae bacterium]